MRQKMTTINDHSNDETLFSWTIPSEGVMYKTADKTLVENNETGIPKNIVSYFIADPLNVGDTTELKLVVDGVAHTIILILKLDGRYKMNLRPIANLLKLNKLIIDKDTVWFERDMEDGQEYYVYTKCSDKTISVKPKQRNKPLRTTATSIQNQRVGQDYFKEEVIEVCGGKCIVTGVDDPSILIASHIKPWIKSTDDERMDGDNGLLLAPHVDKLFDKGLITFNADGTIKLSKYLHTSVMDSWCIEISKKYQLSNKQREYMKYHRDNIFRGNENRS